VINRALDLAVVLLASAIFFILAAGGIDYEWGPVRLRLHDWIRPLTLLALALGARAMTSARGSSGAVATYVSTRALLALLLAIVAIYAHLHVRVAGGLDSYGYVSTASLLAGGRLTEPQPLVSLLPFEHASAAAAPLGYVPARDERTSVPRFPIGLPIVMAVFSIFGPGGPFFVPLVMGYATMALAFLLSSADARFTRPGATGSADAGFTRFGATGLLAAVLVAVDPLMVSYSIQPMSDVPATCWLVAALWLRLDRPAWPIAAGICAGMAVLTRPALLPAAVVLGIVTNEKGVRPLFLPKAHELSKKRGLTPFSFGATLLVFVIFQLLLNWKLYGSPVSSGYGPASHMFELSLSRLFANVSNFGRWLTYSHTALIWLVWPAALVILRRQTWAWQVSAVAASATVPYLFYLVFEDWESLRFLLPAIVLVLILSARALSVALSHLPTVRLKQLGQLSLVVIGLACAVASHRFLDREGVHQFANLEAKYALTGEWFRTHTSDRAVVLAALHSGSIRLYGRRQTIRWDQIPSDKLGATVRSLMTAGYEPYLALDVATEPPIFAERFHAAPETLAEPIARVRVVNIYRFVSAP
jgi:hypothetical protein